MGESEFKCRWYSVLSAGRSHIIKYSTQVNLKDPCFLGNQYESTAAAFYVPALPAEKYEFYKRNFDEYLDPSPSSCFVTEVINIILLYGIDLEMFACSLFLFVIGNLSDVFFKILVSSKMGAQLVIVK